MKLLDAETLKVKAAALVGLLSPGVNLFLQESEPILILLIRLGQIGVAAVTILYVYRKWRQLKSK